jgi:hypothetical protein
MIIVYPYQVSSLILTHDSIGERFVYCNIMLPALILPCFEFWIVRNLIMESRPDNLLAISIVMALEICIGDKYWNRLLFGAKGLGDLRLLFGAQCICGLRKSALNSEK